MFTHVKTYFIMIKKIIHFNFQGMLDKNIFQRFQSWIQHDNPSIYGFREDKLSHQSLGQLSHLTKLATSISDEFLNHGGWDSHTKPTLTD